MVNIKSITEPVAIENAIEFLKITDIDTIVSAGGENFLAYSLDPELKVIKVESGNKCASGTGEFFLQQIKRMNLNKRKSYCFRIKWNSTQNFWKMQCIL